MSTAVIPYDGQFAVYGEYGRYLHYNGNPTCGPKYDPITWLVNAPMRRAMHGEFIARMQNPDARARFATTIALPPVLTNIIMGYWEPSQIDHFAMVMATGRVIIHHTFNDVTTTVAIKRDGDGFRFVNHSCWPKLETQWGRSSSIAPGELMTWFDRGVIAHKLYRNADRAMLDTPRVSYQSKPGMIRSSDHSIIKSFKRMSRKVMLPVS